MKKLLTGWLMLALIMISFTSCDDTVDVPDVNMVDVTLDFNQLLNKADVTKVANKSYTSKDATQIPYPECTDESPTYIEVTIDGTMYTVEFTSLGSQTEVIQLDASANNIITLLEVFGDTTAPIYSMPEAGSKEAIDGGLTSVPYDMNLGGFTKTKVSVDVVCWHEYSHQALAWQWYEINYHQIKTLCFFGDVCTKFYADFGATEYDLVAAIRVDIYNGNTLYVSETNQVSSSFVGLEGSPLCVEYLDDELIDEDFTFSLTLLTPTGEVLLEDHTPFDDGVYSTDDGTGGFGGADGIWNFNVGECGNTANEANYPAYLPLPDEVTFKLKDANGDKYGKYRMEFGSLNGSVASPVMSFGALYHGWCVDKSTTINWNVSYEAKVYSLLDVANLPSTTRINKIKAKAGVLHWIINHIDEIVAAGYDKHDIQNLIWHVVNGFSVNASLTTYAAGIPNYNPKVGDYALVVFDPINSSGNPVQAFGVRIDP